MYPIMGDLSQGDEKIRPIRSSKCVPVNIQGKSMIGMINLRADSI